MAKKIILACSIFKMEIEKLKEMENFDIPMFYIDSILHMNPDKLETLLDEKMVQLNEYSIFLIYGDCHARIMDCNQIPGITKCEGINCCEIILGKDEYRKLRREGAFIILPEWIDKWKEVFINYMGFKNQSTTSVFMNDMHKKIVYIDTGVQEVPHQVLSEISKYFNLPYEVIPNNLEELRKQINNFIG